MQSSIAQAEASVANGMFLRVSTLLPYLKSWQWVRRGSKTSTLVFLSSPMRRLFCYTPAMHQACVAAPLALCSVWQGHLRGAAEALASASSSCGLRQWQGIIACHSCQHIVQAAEQQLQQQVAERTALLYLTLKAPESPRSRLCGRHGSKVNHKEGSSRSAAALQSCSAQRKACPCPLCHKLSKSTKQRYDFLHCEQRC